MATMTVEIEPAGAMTLRVGELIWLYAPGECWLALVGYGVLWREHRTPRAADPAHETIRHRTATRRAALEHAAPDDHDTALAGVRRAHGRLRSACPLEHALHLEYPIADTREPEALLTCYIDLLASLRERADHRRLKNGRPCAPHARTSSNTAHKPHLPSNTPKPRRSPATAQSK
jgi:hypothetical protein